jgi:Asp-tRNA(Asn)/Glu-tRNA(Gln) amidotransferase A subunit family amidase
MKHVAHSLLLVAAAAAIASGCDTASDAPTEFRVEEATIADIQGAIRSGATTCRGVVEAYIERARAYNGICTEIVTADAQLLPPALGAIRAGVRIEFPTQTVAASDVFPDLDEYRGLPLELGRMERTVSDSSVWAQMGMRVGIPDAGQVNALETFNLRGERSVTCKGDFDAHPSSGPLPAGAPEVCERFRQQPDALERADELDAQYGADPDVAALPMYCVVAAIKDVYDTKDMRSTANNDVAFAMDAPPSDAPVVAALRAKGAIIYAKSVAHEFNGGPGNPGGPASARLNWPDGGEGVSSWSGQPCNPYDTERVPRGSSSGSGPAVSTNLVTIGICEQSGASCQGPGSRNGVATLLTTKGLLPGQGGIGYQAINDRPGIHARTLGDAVRVLDAIVEPAAGSYDRIDPFSAVFRALVPERPYHEFAVTRADLETNPRPLEGVRIAILREHMVKSTPNHVAISDRINQEILTVLHDRLGAELIEVPYPEYPDDPALPDVTFTFNDALARILPTHMPEVFTRRDREGKLWFDVPGWDVTSQKYLLAVSRGEAPMTDRVTLANFANFAADPCTRSCQGFTFAMNKYLLDRGDAKITDWAAWVRNAKFREDDSRAGAENWARLDPTPDPGQGDRLARSYVGRMALQMMMDENDIDVFVHSENNVPTRKILGPYIGTISLEGITPFLQIPRVVVPAGMNDVIYEAEWALSEDRRDYVSVLPEGTPQTRLRKPLPIAITFFANQGDEPTLIQVGTAYEAATGHRTPPPDFGPVSKSLAAR